MRALGLSVDRVVGAIGILSGCLALYAIAGGALHRKSGGVLVFAMVTRGIVGAGLAALRNVAPAANVPVGLLTAYLVVTGVESVRATAYWRRFESALTMLA